jgi:hypothetical protein
MKKGFSAIILGTILCLPCFGLAHEPVKVEGTIQGLLSTCAGETCTPREEVIIAAMEDTFVLVSDEGKYYLLPDIKNSVLSRYLNDPVRVTGTMTLDGTALQVDTAEVLEEGEWVVFWSPEIEEQAEVKRKQLKKKRPLPGTRKRTRQEMGHSK